MKCIWRKANDTFSTRIPTTPSNAVYALLLLYFSSFFFFRFEHNTTARHDDDVVVVEGWKYLVQKMRKVSTTRRNTTLRKRRQRNSTFKIQKCKIMRFFCPLSLLFSVCAHENVCVRVFVLWEGELWSRYYFILLLLLLLLPLLYHVGWLYADDGWLW